MAFLGIGSKPKIPTLDAGALNAINQKNANAQRQLITQNFSELQPINQNYQTQRNALSASVQPQVEENLTKFGAGLSGVNDAEAAMRTQATNAQRSQAFRNVPALQRAIRNSLGGSGTFNSGGGAAALAQPTVQAAQNASDFAAQQENERLANVANRANTLTNTGFNTRQQALATKLGLDSDTIDKLTQMGRTDLVNKFNSLVGVQDTEGANELNIEQERQQNAIAQAQAAAAQRGGILGSLGSVAGTGIGALVGGPLGAGIGGQLGGMLGNAAGGTTPQQFDPSLLIALAQRNGPQQKYAVTSSLGRVPYSTGRYT